MKDYNVLQDMVKEYEKESDDRIMFNYNLWEAYADKLKDKDDKHVIKLHGLDPEDTYKYICPHCGSSHYNYY